MAHEIAKQVNGSDAFARCERSAPAWHEPETKATLVPTGSSALSLAHAAGLTSDIAKERTFTVDGKTAGFCVIRVADRKVLGSVGEGYSVVKAETLAALVDSLASRGLVRPDTAMGLRNSSRMALSAEVVGSVRRIKKDDDVGMHLMVAQAYDGSMSVRATLSAVRVVCANTMAAAFDAATHKWASKHTINVESSLKSIEDSIIAAIGGFDATVEKYKQLAETPFTVDDFHALAATAFPQIAKAKPRDESTRGRKPTLLPALEEKFHNGLGTHGKTAWDGYNAITEHLTHATNRNDAQDVAARALAAAIEMSDHILQIQMRDGTTIPITDAIAAGQSIPEGSLTDWLLDS